MHTYQPIRIKYTNRTWTYLSLQIWNKFSQTLKSFYPLGDDPMVTPEDYNLCTVAVSNLDRVALKPENC